MIRTRMGGRSAICVLLAGLLSVGGAALTARDAAATGGPCPPNDAQTSIVSEHRCVAELERQVRQSPAAACITDPRAVSPANPLYGPQECLGGSGVQAEAIAQARLLARYNAEATTALFGDAPAVNGVSANAQWEVHTPGGRRVDALVYDRADDTTPIELIELKQRTRPGSEAAAIAQVNGYLQSLPAGSANRARVLHNFGSGYEDFYRVLVRDCRPGVTTRLVRQYQVEISSQSAGVLMIDHTDELTQCPRQGDPPLDPVPLEEPRDTDVPEDTDDPFTPPIPIRGPGSDDDDDGWDDFYQDLREHIPEFEFDYPAPLEEVPTSVLLVGAGLVVVAVACVTIFQAACAAALAGGSSGAATVEFAVTVLGGLLAGLVAWNIWGDPHLVTLDRLQYDLQSVGEFHLLELPDADIDVQARFRPSGSDVSVLDRIATEINDQRIEIGSSWARIDGVDQNLQVGGAVPLGDGALLARAAEGFILVWPGMVGQPLSLLARGNRVGFALPPADLVGTPRGLLGNNDGDPHNDLALRDGTPLPANASRTTLHGAFADSWRVSEAESLFTYGPNESTATFTDRAFPRNVVTTGDFSEAQVAAATTTCSEAGVQPGPQFDGCVLDVLVTGDDTYAESAALVTDVIVSATGATFDAAGHLSVDFEESVPANFASARYSADAQTTRIAGPIFDEGGYRFYVRSIGRHDNMLLETDIYAFGPISSDGPAQTVGITVNRRDVGSILFDGGGPRLSDGTVGSLAATGSGTTAAGKQFVRYRLHLDLGRPGDALDVELRPNNFSGVLNTSLGIDNVDLTIDVPQAQTFATEIPLAAPGAVGSGMHAGDGAGVLESPGSADIYTFDVTVENADQPFVISPRRCTTSLNLILTHQVTGTRAGQWPGCSRVTTPPLAAGPYALAVSPYESRAAGTYSLELFALPDPQQFEYAVGSTVREGVPGAGAGVLETVASVDVYSFSSPGGDLFLDHRACVNGMRWELRARETRTHIASGFCSDRLLGGLVAGQYEFTVRAESDAGTYAFQLFTTPVAAEDFTTSLPLTVSDQLPSNGAGNLETQQSVDRYSFSVEAPAPLYVDVQACLDNGELAWTLRSNSSGSVVDSGGCADKETAALPAGQYRLDIGSASQGVGPYALQTWLVPMPPQQFTVTVPASISPDNPAPGAGNLETKASRDVYSFSLPDGYTALYLDQIECSVPNMLTWRLVSDVDGVAVTVANGTCEDRQIRQVAQGQYRLEVDPVGEAHGTYSLQIVPSETGSPTIVHVPVATAFYGQPIPVSVTTTCEVPDDCFARLHYRASSHETPTLLELPAGAWRTVEFAPGSATTVDGQTLIPWSASIPGDVVTTTGVDYYVTAGDGANRNELPTAPPVPLDFTGQLGGVVDTPYLHITTVSPPLLAHVPPPYVQADTDVRLELRATCSTPSCTARLHYRTSTGALQTELLTDPGWPTVTMSQTASTPLGDAGRLLTFAATVPGEDVDTRGLDYYFDVADGHTTTYWPGTAYQGYYLPTDGMRTGYQTVHVVEPPHIIHIPVATTPYRAPTAITATTNCPRTRVCTARLYYRTTTIGGSDGLFTDEDFTSVPMSVTRLSTLLGNDVITVAATIPGSFADTRGIDYFFRVDDGSTTTWFPGTGQLQGYVSLDGVRVAYQHVRVLEQPHIAHVPMLATEALQPYTITSQMTCATQECSLTLHWRNDLVPGESDVGWHEVAMSPTGAPVATPLGALYTYTATIPAEKVTTRGLAYFLEGFDGHVHDYSPGTSYWGAYLPLDGQHIDAPVTLADGSTLAVGSYIVRVLEPPHLVHAPPGAVERGQPLQLSARSNCSSEACPATLTWTDAAGDHQTVTMTAVRSVDGDAQHPAVPGDVWEYTATIPPSDTIATVHYSIAVTDGYTSDATPALQALVYDSPAP